jgi:hypothetical protein
MTVSYQISDKRGDAILVVRVEEATVEQAESAFAAAVGLAGLGNAYESFGIPNPVAAVPAAAVATRPAQDPWGQPPVQPMQYAPQVPQAAVQQPAGPTPPDPCQHGAWLYREGVAQATGRPWKAWFCAASSSDPTQCQKKWIR